MFRRYVALVGAAALLVLANAVGAAAHETPSRELASSPIVGHVTESTAMVWATTLDDPQKLALEYRAKGDADAPTLRVAGDVRLDAAFTSVVFTASGLQPDTDYLYRLRWADEAADPHTDAEIDPWQAPSHDGRSGEFTTAPPTGRPGTFTIAVSSCMHSTKEPEQLSWRLMRSQQPSLHLLIGDVVYADTTDRDTLWEHHLRQRAVTDFAAVLRETPTYPMWDDHDYGPNDSDGTAEGKENSLRAFGELWALPPLGVDDDAKRMLGDEQFAWLVDGLKRSTATFKILASGSTLRKSGGDGWRIYSFARERLYNAIMDHEIQGVMYLSGDVHASLLEIHETGGYPLVEVISSGIANSGWKSFATLAFDTTIDDPSVRVRIINGDGSVPVDKTFALSAMTVTK